MYILVSLVYMYTYNIVTSICIDLSKNKIIRICIRIYHHTAFTLFYFPLPPVFDRT